MRTPSFTTHALYMEHVFDSNAAILRRWRERVAAYEDARGPIPEFDTMVGSGLSGALIVPRLARSLHKRWLIVRKEVDRKSSHSGNVAEGTLGPRWLFVDDFISTGTTFVRVKEAVDAVAKCAAAYRGIHLDPVCAGAYLYENTRPWWEDRDEDDFDSPNMIVVRDTIPTLI